MSEMQELIEELVHGGELGTKDRAEIIKSLLEQVVKEIKTEIRTTPCAGDSEKHHNENYLKYRIEKRVGKWWEQQNLTFSED